MKIARIYDAPNVCEDCPLYHKPWCELSFVAVKDENEIPDWCELIDLPKEKEIDESNEHPINDGYVLGWNACLTKIKGE